MVEDQQARLGFACQFGKLCRCRVVLFRKSSESSGWGAPRFRAPREPCGRVHFVHQHVAAAASVNSCLRRVCVAGNDDNAIRRVEAVSIALHRVLRRKRSYRHLSVLIHDSTGNLVGVDFAAFRKCPLITIRVRSRIDIDAVCREQVIRHFLQTLGTIDLERDSAPHRPWREDQVGEPNGVIGMEVSEKRYTQIRRLERFQTVSRRRRPWRAEQHPGRDRQCTLRRPRLQRLQGRSGQGPAPEFQFPRGQPLFGWFAAALLPE